MILFLPIVSIFLLNLLSFVSSLPVGGSLEAGSSSTLGYRPGQVILLENRYKWRSRPELESLSARKYPAISIGYWRGRLLVLHVYSGKSTDMSKIQKPNSEILSTLAGFPKDFHIEGSCPTLVGNRLYALSKENSKAIDKGENGYVIPNDAFYKVLQYANDLEIYNSSDEIMIATSASKFREVIHRNLELCKVSNMPSASTSSNTPLQPPMSTPPPTDELVQAPAQDYSPDVMAAYKMLQEISAGISAKGVGAG